MTTKRKVFVGTPGIVQPDVIRTITKAAHDVTVVTIIYVNNKGELTYRDTEPYEIKDGKYWGYCLEKMGIRQFHLGNIVDAKLTNIKFKPRWPIKII